MSFDHDRAVIETTTIGPYRGNEPGEFGAIMKNGLALVTGGAGFIGQHLVKLLCDRGIKARVLDLADWPDAPRRCDIRQGSILDPKALTMAMQGVSHLFHLAADPNLWARNKNHFMHVNYEGTCRVLEAAAKAKVMKVVYCSTESILKGRKKSNLGEMISEKAAPSLRDMPGAYCKSKFLAEEAALAAAKTGLPVTIVNPTMPMGPGDRRLTPPMKMLKSLLTGDVPAYFDWQMNLVDVRDAAIGHILAAEKGMVGERYILGGHNIYFSELIDEIARLTGNDRALPKRRIPYLIAYFYAIFGEILAKMNGRPPRAPLAGVVLAGSPMVFDSAKARNELGWVPRDLSETLKESIAWLGVK